MFRSGKTAGLTRRRLLQGAGALGASSLLPLAAPRAAPPARTEVAVVGAGMAGLAAARGLIEQGIAVEILEARQRVGGRAFTDRSLGLGFDAGAAWLHGADRSPLPPLLAAAGFSTQRDVSVPRVLLGGARGDPNELRRAVTAVEAQLAEAARRRDEGPISAFLPPAETPIEQLARQLVGPLDLGGALKEISLQDWWLQANSLPEDRVPGGLGDFVTAYGRDLPVRLGAPVDGIAWGPEGVELKLLGGGTLAAEAVLVTVPTGVLAAGLESAEGLWFDPVLPPWKDWAIRNLPLGRVEKVALRLREGLLSDWGYGENAWLLHRGDDGEAASLQVAPFGRDLVVVTLAGIEALLAPEARIAAALAHLAAAHPLREDRDLIAAAPTAWAETPWTRGAYSHARPGAASARSMLRRPLLGRIHFAGEACSRSWAGQLAGAYETGAAAARQIAYQLRDEG